MFISINMSKPCKTCEKEYPLTDFSICKTTIDGRHNKCRLCRNTYQRTYIQGKKSDTDKGLAEYFTIKLDNIKKQDLRKFPDYVSLLTVEDLFAIYNAHSRTCIYSKTKVGIAKSIYERASFDRIDNDKPHSKDNLQLTSVFMNMTRGSKTHEEFMTIINSHYV